MLECELIILEYRLAVEREQEAHLRTIADYNRVAVENEKLREHLAEADEANRLHLQDK